MEVRRVAKVVSLETMKELEFLNNSFFTWFSRPPLMYYMLGGRSNPEVLTRRARTQRSEMWLKRPPRLIEPNRWTL